MAVDGVRFLVQLRKLAIRTIRASSRSVRNHPFLVGALLFVIFLYRSSPFLFSLLVSASPVLVCTAVLLGTLLSFGNPQIPEIDKDEKISCEISSLRAASVANATTVFQIGEDKDVGDSAFMGDVCSVSRFEGSLLTPQNSREIVFEQRSVEEADDECKSCEVEFARENDEEMLAFEGDQGHIGDHFESENIEETPTFEGAARDYEVQEKGFENEGSREGSDDGNVGDRVESSSVPWTRVNGDHGDDDEEEDSGSDGAESSSPDPSMADIIPLLDELHPLIECESLIPNNLSHEDSGLPRNGSHSSHVSSINSDEETDHKSAEEEEEEAGDNNDDEEENRGDKEDAEKSAITWTEDDQKNLMDLGSSELERNQRLESLIARRRAKRSMKMMTERNLIDLDDLVLPFQVAPISTTRQNPFDFPNDTFDNMDLPPIPGSAPSRMLQRRNPFDIPYDSGEEKPDLMDDSFQQEFMPPLQKDPVFRRHESFHIGSSIFEFPRQEARDSHRTSRFRPYFIPERLASEGGSSFSSFVRQSSEISEASSFQRQTSELSGSLSFHRQTSGISETSSFQRQSSDLSESKASSAAETEPVSAEVDQEEMKVGDHESTEERTPDPEIDHASEHVEHGSQSSENFDDQVEKRDFDLQMPEIILGESETYIGTDFHQPEQGLGVEINLESIENDRDVDSWVSEARDLAASSGIIEGDMHFTASPVEDKHYSNSSALSSEQNDVKETDEGLVKGEEIGFHLIENSDVQSENLFNTSDFHHHHSRHTHSAERSAFETNLTLETIEEEHIISPSSSLTSEERNITEGFKPDESLMNMQHIRPDDNNSDFPTEQALDLSNSSFNMDLEESHSKDPVYDLSPQASKINLSISSEELPDLENKELKLELDGLLHENVGEDDARVDQEDPTLSVIEERHANPKAEHSIAQADFFSTANVSNEEPDLVNEDVLLAEETSLYPADIVDVSVNFEEQLISVAQEGESVEDHCLIDSPPFHCEEDPFVIPEKFEEVSSENRLHSEVYAEMDDLLSLPLQTVGTSSVSQELTQEPITDFIDFSEPVEGRGEFEFESSVVGDADEKFPFTDSFVPQSNIVTEIDEALLSELDVVGDFHVTELGMPFTQETLEAENIEADISELQDSHLSENKIQFQSLELESVENIEKSSDENTRKSSPDVFFINESQPEVQNAEVFMGEFPYSPVQESEFIENVKQPGDEDAEKSAPEVLFINTFEPEVEDAETCMLELLDSHVLESTITSHVPEPESSQSYENAEIFGTIESINLQNELLVEGTEVDPIGGFESGIRIDEPITTHGDTSKLEKELVAETNESLPAIEEKIEKSTIAAIDVSLDSRVLESDNLIEKDEPAAELNESVHAMEEEIERSTVAAIDVSLDCRVLESDTAIEKSEPAAEINESVHAVEEEIERSTTVAAIDGSLDSCVLESDTVIEKDEPAAEIEELERSAIDASSDSDILKIDAFIEKDEQPAAETNDTVPAMEEEIEWSVIDASSDSHVSTNESLVEKDEQPAAGTNNTIHAITEEIERSATDACSDSHISENDPRIEKDEQPAAETNESVPAMEEEIERSSVDASLDSHVPKNDALNENAETTESALAVEEEIEGSGADNAGIDESSDSHVSKSDAQIEKDEQRAAETNETVPFMEKELESYAIDAFTDSQVSENNAAIENAETNESSLAMEEETEGSGVANAGIDTSSDSHITNSNTVIEKDVPALGDEFDDAQEMGNHQAESIPDATIRQIESEQPTSAQADSSLQLESAELEALQEEDHQMGQIQVSVEHQETSTGSVSVTEESVGQRSSDAAPEMPKREEE